MRLLFSILLVSLLCACATPPEAEVKPKEEAEAPAPPPRVGVVGLVQQSKVRSLNEENWRRAIKGILRGNPEDDNANVVKTHWEVTVFFDAGQQEVIVLDYDPRLRPGQKVKVTGKKFEVLDR